MGRSEEANLVFTRDLLRLDQGHTEEKKAQQGNQQPMLVTQQITPPKYSSHGQVRSYNVSRRYKTCARAIEGLTRKHLKCLTLP